MPDLTGIIYTTDDIKFARELRSALMNEFSKMRIWICIHCIGENNILTASNYWGVALFPKDLEDVIKFVNQFVSVASLNAAIPIGIKKIKKRSTKETITPGN